MSSADSGHPATALFQSFGSLLESISTLYKSITGGFDWQDVSNPLATYVDPFVGVVFSIYTAFALLVMLNLVTGVFVESALKFASSDKADLTIKAYQIFASSETDVPGNISWEDFEAALEGDRMEEFFEALDINKARASDLFRLLDTTGDGAVSIEELVAGGLMLQAPAKAIDIAMLAKSVREFDARVVDLLDALFGPAPLEGLGGAPPEPKPSLPDAVDPFHLDVSQWSSEDI